MLGLKDTNEKLHFSINDNFNAEEIINKKSWKVLIISKTQLPMKTNSKDIIKKNWQSIKPLLARSLTYGVT